MDLTIVTQHDVPAVVHPLIVRTPEALEGRWQECDKLFHDISRIFGDLGVSAVKRKLVARTMNKMELELNPPDLEAAAFGGHTKAAEAAEFGAEFNNSTESTRESSPLKPTNPASPQMPAFTKTLRWRQKNFFPMKRIKEAVFTTNGELWDNDDPDTGLWISKSTWTDGRLVQERTCEKIRLKMFETRCALTQKVNLKNLVKIEKQLRPKDPKDSKDSKDPKDPKDADPEDAEEPKEKDAFEESEGELDGPAESPPDAPPDAPLESLAVAAAAAGADVAAPYQLLRWELEGFDDNPIRFVTFLLLARQDRQDSVTAKSVN